MAKLNLVGVIDCIMHDRQNKTSMMRVRIGKQYVKIERPMTKRFEWSKCKNETVQSGDIIRLSFRVFRRQRND